MLVYRTFPHLSRARAGTPGHPMYLHKPQGKGRLDNPADYDVWYFATTPECAVGETFGDLSSWSDAMFDFPALGGSRRALGTFELPDALDLLDLDDANALVARGLRPIQVVARNRATTQSWALDIFREARADGTRKWQGIRWWSFHRPQWSVIALWQAPSERPIHRSVKVERLDVGHPAVVDAARTLGRIIT